LGKTKRTAAHVAPWWESPHGNCGWLWAAANWRCRPAFGLAPALPSFWRQRASLTIARSALTFARTALALASC